MDLAIVWFLIIGFGIFMYVLMDGFDLGIGILFPFAPDDQARDTMMNSVAPIWDGNETWLVLGGAGLLAAFPMAYAVILPALYFPVLIMLIALIFRGVAFEFRFKAQSSRYLWDISFNAGSALATFAQGVILGAIIQGIHVEDARYVGGMFDWLSPFSVMTGIALLAGYSLIGCGWIILKTEGRVQEWAYDIAPKLLGLVLLFIVIVSVWTPLTDPAIAERWFSWPNIAFLSPVPIITALLAYGFYMALQMRRDYPPFFCALGLFLLSFIGLVISLWPRIVPPDITIWEAASARESQQFLLVGLVIILPFILGYTAWTYWVFRGKLAHGTGYH